ncbi:MAG: B12-binding domain-containing radical SAM protein [Candidatus Riflebacteria bacterium]|nr:B12-binding domain-containing radical SAM protein [Candidatus Riflebacteria bacterium]
MSKDFLLVTPLRILPLPLVPPLGPISVYSYARAKGYDGELVNFNEIITAANIDSHDDIIFKTLEDWLAKNPEVRCVGISVLFSGVFQRALELARTVKRIRSNLNVVLGGIHPTLHAREILENCPEVDFIVIGEGEESFVSLLDVLVKKESQDFKHINGFGYRENGKVFINPRLEYKNRDAIDKMGTLDYSHVDFSKYHSEDMDSWYNPREHNIICAAPLITSLSCPYNCNFCSIHAMHGPSNTYRHRSVDNVLEELKFLYYERQIRYFYVVDDCSTCNKKKALELYGKIAASGMKISLEFQNGLNLRSLDDEIIDAIVEAGMIRGGLAVESGSDLIRNKVIGKGLNTEKIFSVCNRFKNKHPHVWLIAFFIVGLPEETIETLEETLSLVNKLDYVYPVFSAATPTPGTRLWEQCVKDNLLSFDTTNTWRKSFIFADKHGNDKATCWSMRNLESLPEGFVIKPYNLSVPTLSEYYNKFKTIGAARLLTIKSALNSFRGKI